ncbi:hypothetical protein RRG08_058156 [Elysia crispata]|uniref:C-type lectin domain-containing protein n=1 Tax=Elysia crispata TaxID=231223 RepID=A0AAE1CR18_9GAST|nr:hypothetical protein RRG08_058156 [Elysia crispata]
MKITEFWTIWIIALLTVFSTGTQARGITGILGRKVAVGVPVIGSRPNPKLNFGSLSQSTLRKKTGGMAAIKTVETIITENGCPEGFTSFADSCFLEGVIPETWETAGGICKQVGGDLATINSKEEYDFIRREFGNGNKEQMWIGLSKQTPGTPYTWANGERVRYLPWTLNYTGQEPTAYVAMSLNTAQFFPKSNPKTPLPFLCGTKRVPDTASADAAAGGAAAAAGGAVAAAGSANVAEQHKVVDVRAADITQVGLDTKARPEETMITCKEGWERFEDKCFKAFYERATFQNASLRCRQEGGELLSLHSPSQSEFVRTKLLKNSPSEDFWMGLSSGENGLQWSDGSPLDYSNWTPGMSTSQILTPFRTLNPQRKDMLSHLEKCFSLNSERSLWANMKCDGETCYICFDDEDTPVGAAESFTELQGSTTPVPTSPGSTQKTSTAEAEWIFVRQGNKYQGGGAVKPRYVGKLPSYLLNGVPALSTFNISGINLDPKTVVLKSDDSAESESEAEDDQRTLTIFFVVVGTIAAVVMAAIGVIKLREQYGNSPSSWTSLRNSSRANVHSLDNVHQSLRDPETCDENQQGVYGALD